MRMGERPTRQCNNQATERATPSRQTTMYTVRRVWWMRCRFDLLLLLCQRFK